MKFIICTLLLSAIAGIDCFPGAPDYKYTYGLGGKAGFTLNGGKEIGVRAKDGTYSVFANGYLDPSIYGDGGVFINPARPAEAANNPSSQQTQGRTQYPYNMPAPAYIPNTPFIPIIPVYWPNNAGQN